MWNITSDTGRGTSIEALISECGELYAADESGFRVDPEAMTLTPETVADAGYAGRGCRRILFWRCEADSVNDPGQKAIAEARWED